MVASAPSPATGSPRATGETADSQWVEWYAGMRGREAEDRARLAGLQEEADRQWAEWYRNVHPHRTGTRAPAVPSRRPGRGLRMVAGFFILVGCLVVPWLLPWPNQLNNSQAAGPPESVRYAEPRDPAAPAQAAPPDANAIRRLQAATRTQSIGYDRPVSAKELAGVRTTPGPYQKLGRVQIPSVGLSVEYGEGVNEETLLKGPGHWPGTPTPGAVGNSVLSGHRNTHTQPFKELDELRPGDRIITTYENRSPVTFSVVKTTIVREAEYREFVLRQPTNPNARVLTLFACHPEGNPVFRIVVEAHAQR